MTTLEAPPINDQLCQAGDGIDGRLLVDQGVWNNSQNWSDGAAGSGYNLSSLNILMEAQQHMVLQMLTRLLTINFTGTNWWIQSMDVMEHRMPRSTSSLNVNGTDVFSKFSNGPDWINLGGYLNAGAI